MNVAVKWLALLIRIQEVLGLILAGIPAILTQYFFGCPQYLQENPGIVAD
jgi:hypothetical protein